MTYKLTSDAIIASFLSAGCRVSFSTPPLGVSHTIEGRPDEIRNAITSIIEAAMLDTSASSKDSLPLQQAAAVALKSERERVRVLSENNMALELENAELRQQLAAAQNDVKQLRKSRDKCNSHLTMKIKIDTSELKTEMQRIGESIMQASKAFASINSPQSAADKADNDGWIEWQSIVWSDCPVEPGTPVIVRYRDGTVSGVLEAIKPLEGVQRDASVSYWFRHGFDNDIVAYKLAPKAADDDWIEWHGGECPAPKDTWLNVRQRCGRIVSGYAFDKRFDYLTPIYWKHKDHQSDIVAYRLAK